MKTVASHKQNINAILWAGGCGGRGSLIVSTHTVWGPVPRSLVIWGALNGTYDNVQIYLHNSVQYEDFWDQNELMRVINYGNFFLIGKDLEATEGFRVMLNDAGCG